MLYFFQITVGTSGKYKRYQMISGTRDEFVANLEKQFPDEKEAIAKSIDLIEVSLYGGPVHEISVL